MAVRIRKNGRIFCAASNAEEVGDTYIDDGLHYKMAVEHKVLVTLPMPEHGTVAKGEWWWSGSAPDSVEK